MAPMTARPSTPTDPSTTSRGRTEASTEEGTYAAFEVDLLRAWYLEDNDEVETAEIPRLATADHVLVPVAVPAPAASRPADAPEPTAVDHPETSVPASVATTASTRSRHRHADQRSLDAVRRNQVALAAVVTAVLLLGSAVALTGSWVAVAVYAVAVTGLVLARYLAGRRYTPRHTRYAPRHA